MRHSLPLATVIASMLATGCGAADPSATPEDTAAMTAALELENGGMSTSDEAPAFGDALFQSAVPAFNADAPDAVLNRDGLAAGEGPAGDRHVWRVVILWGHLPAPDDAQTNPPPRPAGPTDWSGALSVDRGALSVRHTLGFEALDRVAPRGEPDRVAFTSHTQPFVDGFVLTVAARGDAPPTLRFNTRALDASLRLPADEATVRRLSDGHNGVYLAAYEERSGCAQGFVVGHWRRAGAHLGVLRGRAYDAVGEREGALRGVWGRRRDGSRVFFGKHIDAAGRFDGLFSGRYEDGRFEGVWGLRDGARGALVGRYFDGAERGDGHGLFVGRYRARCE